jgi:hypothetical protein
VLFGKLQKVGTQRPKMPWEFGIETDGVIASIIKKL